MVRARLHSDGGVAGRGGARGREVGTRSVGSVGKARQRELLPVLACWGDDGGDADVALRERSSREVLGGYNGEVEELRTQWRRWLQWRGACRRCGR